MQQDNQHLRHSLPASATATVVNKTRDHDSKMFYMGVEETGMGFVVVVVVVLVVTVVVLVVTVVVLVVTVVVLVVTVVGSKRIN